MKNRIYLNWEYLLILPVNYLIVWLYGDIIESISINTWYMFIPLVITLLIFMYQSYLRKRDNNDYEISFIINEGTFLLNWVGLELIKLKLEYDNVRFKANSILYQGTILNSGNNDIDTESFYKPLAIKLGRNYKLKNIEITHKPEGIDLKYKRINNTLLFEWDLLKSDEFIKFNTIVEFKQKYTIKNMFEILQGLTKDISFSGSRIKNVKFFNTNFSKGESRIFKIKFLLLPLIALWLTAFSLNFYPKEELQLDYSFEGNSDYISFTNDEINSLAAIDSSGNVIDNYKIRGQQWTINGISVNNEFEQDLFLLKFAKSLSWVLLLLLILFWIKRNYYRKRKLIDDFIAKPYYGSSKYQWFK